MKILLIGGTGRISMAISRQLLAEGHDLYLINRGSRSQELEQGLERRPIYLTGDVHDEAQMASLLNGLSFDAVADFIAFDQSDLERDYRLFSGKTDQFLYISSASAYQKPLSHYQITESTPLANPFWEYSRKKIQGEEYLMNLYRTEQFPITIVRPSHTYDERSVPMGVHGSKGSYQVIRRILDHKPVIIHGDGTSLWTVTHNSDFARASSAFWETSTPSENPSTSRLMKPLPGIRSTPFLAVPWENRIFPACMFHRIFWLPAERYTAFPAPSGAIKPIPLSSTTLS